jgi:uncharacterized membrane protein YgcG
MSNLTASGRAAALGALLALAGAAGVALPSSAAAQDVEEILSYDVLVDIQPDARLFVTEEITVRSLGEEIRRGIYRDFPTSFPRASGFGRIEAPFAVHRVLRDGTQEPYEVTSIGGPIGRGGVRIRIGNPNVLIGDGVHSYTIEYETERWIVFGDAADQLYWNATGNGWGFPIRSASARIRLPDPPAGGPDALEVWTGPEGSTDHNATAVWDAGAREAVFRTTDGLGPEEGLTVRVTFPAGSLPHPTPEQEAAWFRLDWGGYLDALYVVALLALAYLFMWTRVGRDPSKGITVTRYEPPEGFSPAALGFLKERGYEPAHFAAALVSMAVKGAVRIEQDGKSWTLHRLDGDPDLAPEERRILLELLGKRESLELKQRHHAVIRAAIKSLKASLSARLEREYFVNNRWWFVSGATLSLIGFGVLAWRARFGIEPAAWFLGIWLTGWTAGVASMLYRATSDLRHGLRSRSLGHGAAGVMMGCFSIPFLAAEVFVGYMFLGMVPTHLALAAVAIGATNVLFYHLLERPTLRGRGVLDRLDGFAQFLSATDEDRLDRTMEPDRTPALFERYLPYAIALGLENRWAARFEDVLTPESVQTTGSTFPWYQGTGSLNASAFASSLGSALSSTLSASSSAPGGSSGGGGGSSGGGGGGGGGGGW